MKSFLFRILSLLFLSAYLLIAVEPTAKSKKQNDGIDTSKYEKVKLIDAVLETLSHSDPLKSAREQVIQYEIKVKNAMAEFYPTVDFEHTFGRTQHSPSGDDFAKFKYFNDNIYKFVLRQNLYSGGADDNNLKSVVKRLEVSKNQYRITIDSEIKKAIKAYFDVVFANRSLVVNERNMEKLNTILKIVTTKYENGAASIGDLTSIKANVANAMTKTLKVKSKFVEALKYYEYIAGSNFENTLPYEKNFDIKIGDFDELYNRALEKNKSLINYYKTIEIEQFNQKKNEANFRPKLDFELSYQKTMDGEDLTEREQDINGKVKLTYNLFNGGKDTNSILESSSKIRDLKYKLSEEEKKIKWNLSTLHTSITSVTNTLESTITEIKASRKMVKSYWDAFKLGEQDLNTLLQGQRQLSSAETELVDFEKSHINDFFGILELTGDLSAFFDVDPENPKFIDFSKSDFQKVIIAKDGDEVSLDGKKKSENKEDDTLTTDDNFNEKLPSIELPKATIDENINKFIEAFSKFDDSSYMIEISDFLNTYDAFEFIKANNISENSFYYDVVSELNINTKIAHNNFATLEEAQKYLKVFEEKNLGKKLEIKQVKDIKESYSKYISGLKITPIEKEVTKTEYKIIEKVKQKTKEDFIVSEEFKNKFLNSDDSKYTVNISSFPNEDLLKDFIDKNEIYDDSFFFKYESNTTLLKLVVGVFDDYDSAFAQARALQIKNSDIFPVVERVGTVKKLYVDNIDLNIIKEEPVKYDYVEVTNNHKDMVQNIQLKAQEESLNTQEEQTNDTLSPLDEKITIKLEESEAIVEPEKIEELVKIDEPIVKQIEESKVEVETSDFVKRFLESPSDKFSIFAASFEEMDDAIAYVKKFKLEDETILVRTTDFKVMVMIGIFEHSVDADAKISTLPAVIVKNKPFVFRLKRAQDLYKKNNLKQTVTQEISNES